MPGRSVSNEELAAHKPRVEALARTMGQRPGVDFDDLVQEGWVYVFEGLRDGHQRTNQQILGRMRRLARTEANQRAGVVPLVEGSQGDADE